MHPSGVLLLVAASACLAGCFDGGDAGPEVEGEARSLGPVCPSAHTEDAAPEEPAPVAMPVREGFEPVTTPLLVNGLPTGWSATDGSWQVEADPEAAEGDNVLHGRGDADPGFSAALAGPAGSLSDFQAEVRFRMDCVEHPHGVGLVLHVADGDDYQILRYSATESSWDLFTVRAGERTKRDDARQADVDPAPGDWTLLRVVSSGGHVEAFSDGRLVVSYTLAPEDAANGQVGLFLRGSSSADFDDVHIDDLPVAAPVPAASPPVTPR